MQRLISSFRTDFFSRSKEDLEKFGQDWSGVLVPNPQAIAFPRTTEEVSQLLKLCTAHRIAVVPSGGRTGLSGGAVATNQELVISLSRTDHIGSVDCASLTIRVQAGAITQKVHEAAAPYGLTWPVDFASKGSSQVGGNISTNAGGVRVIRYGLTRHWVLGLKVVTMNGDILELNGALEKNNTGLDLRQLFIGSEGTLGVITEATLKLAPIPEKVHVSLFSLQGFNEVLELFSLARSGATRGLFVISAFECFSDLCFRSVIATTGLRNPFQSQDGGAYVLMEVEGDASSEEFEKWLGDLFERKKVIEGVAAQSPQEAQNLWRFREGIAESVMTAREVHQQDISVPIENLGIFASDLRDRYATAYPEFEVFIFGHIGDGNLHVFIRKPQGGHEMTREHFHRRCAESDTDLFEFVQAHHGSVSAEHGIGLLKKTALPYSRAAAEIEIFRGVKKIFDPQGLLNPGKIFD